MSYYPSRPDLPVMLSSYDNANSTGIAQALAQQHNDMVRASENNQITRMRCQIEMYEKDLRDLRRMIPPEPSVEVIDYTPSWWSKFFSDPIWEIFKRPKINP